jgi:hypothetical protein
MTAAKALAELRRLLAEEARRPARDEALIRSMLWDCYWVREGGVTPLTELRLKRYRRRAVMRANNHAHH